MNVIENALISDSIRQINEHTPVVSMPGSVRVYGVLVYEPIAFPREQAIYILADAGVIPPAPHGA